MDGTAVKGELVRDRLVWGGLAVPSQVFAEVADESDFWVACNEKVNNKKFLEPAGVCLRTRVRTHLCLTFPSPPCS